MESIPWFAWIAIVAIIVWGLVMVVGSITGRSMPSSRSSADQTEIDQLKQRVSELEMQIDRMSR
ncbi:MAG: hypothetical protein GX920_05450 [Micrococcus sp.]|nr:hypothetical protein [Micrococcus sp.]